MPDPLTLSLLVLAGLLGGFINTVAASGATVTVPSMIQLGLDAPLANGSNRLSAVSSCLTGTWRFHRAGVIPWNITLQLAVPITAGSIAGALLASRLGSNGVELVVALSLLLVLAALVLRPQRWLQEPAEPVPLQATPPLLLVLAAVGLWTGLISLGSGIMTLLALVLLGRQSPASANVVKLPLRLLASVVALVVFLLRGQVVWGWAVPLALASSVGAWIGAKLALGPAANRWIYGTLLAVVVLEIGSLVLQLEPALATGLLAELARLTRLAAAA
ncbi:MAG: sulfite exporter TauE/SafE family protein [Prochlorococcaceae cyanobacterium]